MDGDGEEGGSQRHASRDDATPGTPSASSPASSSGLTPEPKRGATECAKNGGGRVGRSAWLIVIYERAKFDSRLMQD